MIGFIFDLETDAGYGRNYKEFYRDRREDVVGRSHDERNPVDARSSIAESKSG